MSWTREQWRECAEALWGILDDIDTLSDMLKPNDEDGYRKFCSMALKRADKRHLLLHSDGYKLTPPGASGKPAEEAACAVCGGSGSVPVPGEDSHVTCVACLDVEPMTGFVMNVSPAEEAATCGTCGGPRGFIGKVNNSNKPRGGDNQIDCPECVSRELTAATSPRPEPEATCGECGGTGVDPGNSGLPCLACAPEPEARAGACQMDSEDAQVCSSLVVEKVLEIISSIDGAGTDAWADAQGAILNRLAALERADKLHTLDGTEHLRAIQSMQADLRALAAALADLIANGPDRMKSGGLYAAQRIADGAEKSLDADKEKG